MGDYVVDPYPHAKFHQDTITPFRPQIRENAPRPTRLVFKNIFWFFCQPTAKTPTPIFTINTSKRSNDVVSRKDVPFGGTENKILHFDPIFQKNANFWPIFDGTWKILRPKKALTMGMLGSKLPLIVIVAP